MTTNAPIAARLSVDWAYELHDLDLSPPVWQTICRGHPVTVRGPGYWYEGQQFEDEWVFSGGRAGKLRVLYWDAGGDWDGAEGFEGSLSGVSLEEFEDVVWSAYSTTVFEVDRPEEIAPPFELHVGTCSPEVDLLVQRNGSESWAYVTAWNPGDERPSVEENHAENLRLRAAIEDQGLKWVSGRGRGADSRWVPEESYLIIGATFQQGIELGRAFGQRAILVGRDGEEAILLDCAVSAAEQLVGQQ